MSLREQKIPPPSPLERQQQQNGEEKGEEEVETDEPQPAVPSLTDSAAIGLSKPQAPGPSANPVVTMGASQPLSSSHRGEGGGGGHNAPFENETPVQECRDTSEAPDTRSASLCLHVDGGSVHVGGGSGGGGGGGGGGVGGGDGGGGFSSKNAEEAGSFDAVAVAAVASLGKMACVDGCCGGNGGGGGGGGGGGSFSSKNAEEPGGSAVAAAAAAAAAEGVASLKTMFHLFRHGTVASLELELARVGREGLRALRTADVGAYSVLSDCSDFPLGRESARAGGGGYSYHARP